MKKRYNNRNVSQHFTLIEIVAVMAIMILIGILVIGRMGKVPAMVAVTNAGVRLERLFSYASQLSVQNGKKMEIAFYRNDNHFEILRTKSDSSASDLLKSMNFYSVPRTISVAFLPNPWEEDKTDDGSGTLIAEFYPDGSGAALETRIASGGNEIALNFSVLTGLLRRSVVAEGEEIIEKE